MDQLQSLSARFLNKECTDIYFKQLNFFHVPCFKLLLSKVLGVGIILGAVVVKLPQIRKIYPSGRIEGLSQSSFMLSLVAYTISFSYSFSNGFPFSTYGENLVMTFQDLAIVGLLMHYSHTSAAVMVGCAAIYFALVAWLLSGLVAPALFVTLQSSTTLLTISSKLPQIWSNFSQSSTGQLSFLTTLLQFVGCLGRIFTTIQEVNDSAILFGFISAGVLNGILVFQVLYYWNAPATATVTQTTGAPKKKSVQ